MTDLAQSTQVPVYRATHKVRVVTAAALFDGHDASINVMRRILQASGAEVIHLGHNRSAGEIAAAALQEDAQAVAVTSYQGGHLEFFPYLLELLRRQGGEGIKVFGGGGGVIVEREIRQLHECGVTRIYSPHDGAEVGLQGMINDLLERSDFDPGEQAPPPDQLLAALGGGSLRVLARAITALEQGRYDAPTRQALHAAAAREHGAAPAVGITGTGGAGKSSLADELVLRLRLDQQDRLKLAILSIDPSRRRGGGALLGDRIRMNAIDHERIFMRSFATRDTGTELCRALPEAIAACRLAGFDLILVETSGIGQGSAAIVPLVDLSLYVMTPEYGAASQLEKIDMLDLADLVAVNKFDRRGAEDALRDVRKQVQRNRALFSAPLEQMPVFGTQASRFNDDGVTALYQAMMAALRAKGLRLGAGRLPPVSVQASSRLRPTVPPERSDYLAQIARTVRDYHAHTAQQCRLARERQALQTARDLFAASGRPTADFDALIQAKRGELAPEAARLLDDWPSRRAAYAQQAGPETLAGTRVPKVALPPFEEDGERLRFLMRENLPGAFPFTAGVFAFKRQTEEPTRMFAGEGDAFRTNRRFKKIAEGMRAHRLSTAFDSVTLYGCDPDARPDIYGKVGNSGVSIATLDDMQALYDGFDLCSPDTSVSMTINGPAPIILAMFFNTAIDQQAQRFAQEQGRAPAPQELAQIRAAALATVRGTVQADILKEDQGQNTCIFSTEFALKMMGDIQEYFVRHRVRNFYSVSISGYHIAEAGANPVSQLAFTLANAFTYVEAYLARGMRIDDFVPNLSFFFSNGMDAEYAVIGRVARRIWAVAMKQRYGAGERSQKLKYHAQTSGRSLHAQEVAFNDIRTTLQALIAVYDNCNSLHTNAFDEAITTPTEESLRRALAIQLIINREWGLAGNENPNQGSFILEQLTDLVEQAVLREFDAISARGGVLGAMEMGYQRARIQDESLLYERRKHDGSYPIVGVNMFRAEGEQGGRELPLARSTQAEKESQLRRLQQFQRRHRDDSAVWLDRLRQTVLQEGNVFEVLMDAVRCCSLGQISNALYEAGGRYRRTM